MIFVGDIAIPYSEAINIDTLPIEFYNKNWFGNLEGALIHNSEKSNLGIYNSIEGVKKLTKKLNFKGFALANNHIFDVGNFQQTIGELEQLNVPFCGIGVNIFEANKELIIYEDGIEIIIINFGWEVIQCQVAKENRNGVNPLIKRHVILTVKKLISKYPNGKIIPFMHWGYELEGEPQPFERELAKYLIDLGVAGVIGCHSHRIGGFEVYKGKPIVYSLGNWMFKQNYYFDGKHKFPDFCNMQLGFELNFNANSFSFHFFYYDKESSELKYLKSEDINSKIMYDNTPFQGMTKEKYNKWYKVNHYHKNKGLPIYYWDDSILLILLKNYFNKIRDKFILIILKLKKRL